MSFVRVNRYSPRGGGRKALKVKKKKTPVKQEWDVSLWGKKQCDSTWEEQVCAIGPRESGRCSGWGSACNRVAWVYGHVTS